MIDPQTYTCGIRSTAPDGRVILRLVRQSTDALVPGEIAPTEFDLVLPPESSQDLIPGDLVTCTLVKVQA